MTGDGSFGFTVTRKDVLRRTWWVMLGQVAVRSRGLLSLPIAVRVLGAGGYGVYSTVTALAGLCAVIAVLNVPDGSARLVVGAPDEVHAEVRVTAIRRFGTVVALVLAGVGGLLWFAGELVPGQVGVLTGALVLFKASTVRLEYFQHLKRAVRFQVGSEYVGIAAGLALATRYDVSGAVLGYAGGIALAALLVRGHVVPVDREPRFIRRAARVSVPLLPVAISQWAVFSLDTVLLLHYRGDRDTGLYSAAYSLASAALVLVFAVNAVWPATCQRLLAESQDAFRNAFRRAALAVLAVGVLGVVASWLVRPVLGAFLGHGPFEDAVRLTPILVAAFVVLALAKLAEGTLYAVGDVRTILAWYAVGAVVNLALNLVLIPRHGPVAAAWTTLAGYVVIAGGLFASWGLARSRKDLARAVRS